MSNAKIEFDYDGTHYVLEHTADSLKKAEKLGLLKFGKIDEMVLTAGENMFKSLFIKNHPTTSDAKRHEIYMALTRTEEGSRGVCDDDGEIADELGEAVAAIINEAIEEITGRGKKGNVVWKMTK